MFLRCSLFWAASLYNLIYSNCIGRIFHFPNLAEQICYWSCILYFFFMLKDTPFVHWLREKGQHSANDKEKKHAHRLNARKLLDIKAQTNILNTTKLRNMLHFYGTLKNPDAQDVRVIIKCINFSSFLNIVMAKDITWWKTEIRLTKTILLLSHTIPKKHTESTAH